MTFLDATTAPLTAVLRQVAIDIAEAQKALDDLARSQVPDPDINDPDLINPVLAPIAFHFPEVELDLSLAFSVTQFEGRNTLAVAPANPIANGFFQSASFSSRLRAKIAPRPPS